jgi:hypothetical protein
VLGDAFRQIRETNPTFFNEINERVSCLAALQTKGLHFYKTTKTFFNEISDACLLREFRAMPAEQTQFFPDRIEGARWRVHPHTDTTPFWRNGETN